MAVMNTLATALVGFASVVQGIKVQDGSNLISDSVTYGPTLELIHLYYDEFPTGMRIRIGSQISSNGCLGIAVSSTGRLFSNYPPGLDANNTNNGQNGKYTIAELFDDNTGKCDPIICINWELNRIQRQASFSHMLTPLMRSEKPYPSAEINNPPGGSINYTTYPPTGANYQNYLIGCQSAVIDAQDRLWLLDTGRALTPNMTLVPASYGGPKLVGVDLSSNKVIQTIVFPVTVAYADSYLNDVRFDLRSDITSSGKGVAYITDSSAEGRNGIIIVDLGTGESWRHLDRDPRVNPEQSWLAYNWGIPLYQIGTVPKFSHGLIGSDGIALSADGSRLFWKPLTSRQLYSIPTANLIAHDTYSEVLAQAAVNDHGQTGLTDGMETDTNNYIYHGNMEQDAVSYYDPATGTDNLFVRDPRLNWIDTFSVATDGYLYFTNNQLGFSPGFWPGTDRRQRPFSLWRARLPNGGTKVT